MNRINKAINEANIIKHKKADSQPMFQKQGRSDIRDLYAFNTGDYVYYSDTYGYTNDPRLGAKYAVCANDEDGLKIYVVLNHYLSTHRLPWAKPNTNLFSDTVESDDPDSGWVTTNYIRENYENDIEGTIFDKSILKPNEYIPSKFELANARAYFSYTGSFDESHILNYNSWTSSQYFHNIHAAVYYVDKYNRVEIGMKYDELYTMVLLKLDA